jgi:hypothetical protein
MRGQKTGGRAKGSLNKTTPELRAFTRAFLASPAYVTSAKRRVLNGTAPHLETLWHHYAFGKPRQTVQVQDGAIPLFVLKLDAESVSFDALGGDHAFRQLATTHPAEFARGPERTTP